MYAYQIGDEVEVAFEILKSPLTLEVETVYVKGKVVYVDEGVVSVSLQRPGTEKEEIWAFPPGVVFPTEA